MPTCEKTLTYVMETEDAGFGNSMMKLWMSFGLAMKEGRAFFIDDTRWYVHLSMQQFTLITIGRTGTTPTILHLRLLQTASLHQHPTWFPARITPAIL